ncbi:MAG: ribbon-helix-helix protein, CopG family [Deltaproteobacteria bacterium]|nr:ribbon-helix-helix protein, CopG family [Deltaproteobacteria bacterium]
MAKQNVSATLDEGLLKKLDDLAKETERNRSWLIGKALENYFEETEDVRVALGRLEDKRLTPKGLRKEIGL